MGEAYRVGNMVVGSLARRAHRLPRPLAIAAVSLIVGAAGIGLTLPGSPELIAFTGYPVERVERPAGVVSESVFAEPEAAPEAVLPVESSPLWAAVPVFASADAQPGPIEKPTEPPIATDPPMASPPSASTPAPTLPSIPVEAASYGGVEPLPALEHSSTPATKPAASQTSAAGKTTTPAPAVTVEPKRPGKSSDAPGKNKQAETNAAGPQSRGQDKSSRLAGEESKLPPGQAKKNQR